MNASEKTNKSAYLSNWSVVFKALPFCLAYTFPFLVLLTALGSWALLAVPIFTFLLVPGLDIVSGIDAFNPSAENESELRDNLIFRLITWIWVPMELSIIIFGMWWVLQPERTALDILGMCFAVGMTSGVIGITFAHELMHKSNKFEQALAEILMTVVSYPHFCIEHILGHHKNVGTKGDPATARLGENFYAFYWRVLTTSFWSVWNIEKQRLLKSGQGQWRNRVLRYALTLAAIYALLFLSFGWLAVFFFLVQSLIAFSSLEITNYIEHYGLVRKEIAPGVYERTLPKHSWNSGHRVSNWFLINLARHSDHHFIASKRYQILTNVEDTAPQLPFGYGTMFLIALLPPIWFRLMNPRVLDWQQGNISTKKDKQMVGVLIRFKLIELLTILQKWGNVVGG